MAVAIRRNKNSIIKGGELITRILAAEGVEQVFGIIDGTYMGLFGSFEKNGISFLTPRHETSAAHAAGAYARLTGKLGVCIASNGPGVANILPGVVVEQAEGNRVLLITSCRREGLMGPDRGGSYQYFAQTAVTAPTTKLSVTVNEIGRLAEVMRHALRVSYTGRPGVVHVDVPESIMNGQFELDPTWLQEPSQYRNTTPIAPAPELVAAAARMLSTAKKPLIHAGSGVIHADASAALKKLAAILDAPITTSWGARAAVDERDEHSMPMLHIETVNKARVEADLILVLGSRLGETDWWGKAPYWGRPEDQQMIQVDIDADILGNTRPADLLVQADVKEFIEALNLVLGSKDFARADRQKWLKTLNTQKSKHRAKLDKHLNDMAAPMNSAHVAKVCQEVFPAKTVTVLDGGNTAIWGNFFHQVRGTGQMLGTPKMGMLGAGVSQAIGAAVATPGVPVCCIIGDGAMGFHQQEIETAVRNNLPVIYLVLCDKQWGMVKMTQQFALKPLKTLIKKSLDPGETINADLGETRFDDLARAMGAYGERVGDPAGLAGAIKRALQTKRTSVIHVDVDPVKHMWAPALQHFKAMHQEPKG